MKTVGEIIARADSIRANPFTEAQKAEWVAQVDAKICADYLSKKYPTDGYRRQGDQSPVSLVPGGIKIKELFQIDFAIDTDGISADLMVLLEPSWIPKNGDQIVLTGLRSPRGTPAIPNPEMMNARWSIQDVLNEAWQHIEDEAPQHFRAWLQLKDSPTEETEAPVWWYVRGDNPEMAVWYSPKPTNPEWLLSVPEPWDELYVVHLLAQIDFYQGETIRHNAMLAKFQDLLEQYTAHLARQGEFEPKTIEDVPKIIY